MDFQDVQSDDEKSDDTTDSQNSVQLAVEPEGSQTGAKETKTDPQESAVAISAEKKNKEQGATIDTISTSNSSLRTSKHVSFVCVEETTTECPATSKIIENVKEYVRQIEQQTEIIEEQRREESKIITKQPQLQQKIIFELTERPRLTLFETMRLGSSHSDEQKPLLPSPELPLPSTEQQKQQQQEEMQVALVDRDGRDRDNVIEKAPFKEMETENQEIAERFKQIMEMFDNFTKNLESLEMPAIKEHSASTSSSSSSSKAMGKKCDSNWKLDSTPKAKTESTSSTSSSSSLSSVKIIEPQVHASSYAQYFQDLGAATGESTTEEINEAISSAEQKSATAKSQVSETIIDMLTPRNTKDISTTMSICGLYGPYTDTISRRQAADLIDNACQTQKQGDDGDFEGITILPSVHSSSSFSTSRTSQTNIMPNYVNDCKVQTFIFDSVEAAEAIAKNNNTNNSNNNNKNDNNAIAGKITTKDATTIDGGTNSSVGEGKAKKITPNNSGLTLVKVTESPSIIELGPLTTATTATAGAPTGASPCERTFHTIHIEAASSPTSSIMRRPPLCLRLWNVITDFCAAACLCIQVNKDCLFCLGFFIAFVVSASFLTAFFYRTLSINPQLFQYSQVVEQQREAAAVPILKKDSFFHSL